MRLKLKSLLEMNNIFGQKMTSFELLNLKTAVDEEVLHDMLKEHELYLTMGGAKASTLIYDDMMFFAMVKLADKVAPDTKTVKCHGRLDKVKYSTKDEALYGTFAVVTNVKGTDSHLILGIKCRYDSDTDDKPIIEEVPKSKVISMTTDDIDLIDIMPRGVVTKSVVRVK